MYIPPYELNSQILNLATKITEKLTRLEMTINKKRNLYLRKISKIKSVNSSCGIEANTLTEEEVLTIINGKTVLAPQNEITEVKNAYNSYSNINNFDPYNVNSFLKAHKLLTNGLVQESGQFRSRDVGVFNGQNVIHMGTRPEFIPKLIEDLFSWAKNSDLNPLIKSSIVHFEIEYIHPFNDGNGRIGRLWQSLILYKFNNVFEYLPIEKLVYENQQRYYDALSNAGRDATSTIFIQFMLDMILKTIENFEGEYFLKTIKNFDINVLSKTEKEVLRELLRYFNNNEIMDIKTASNILNKNEANVRKYFRKFVSLDILLAIGETKGRKYKLVQRAE
jgi:Fic family protein